MKVKRLHLSIIEDIATCEELKFQLKGAYQTENFLNFQKRTALNLMLPDRDKSFQSNTVLILFSIETKRSSVI